MTWQVVHVITRLDLGGAQLATLHQVRAGRFGVRRTLLHGPGGQLQESREAMAGIDAIEIPDLVREVMPSRDLRAVTQLCKALRALRRRHPGSRLLVHTHSSKAGILGRLAARLVGAERVVHTAHGFGHSHHGSTMMRWAFAQAERLTGRMTHAFTGDSAANLYQGNHEKLFASHAVQRVVRCGIDLPTFARRSVPDGLRRELGLSRAHRVVITVACLKPQKDPMTLLEVAVRVRRAHPQPVAFVVVGDGELRRALEARIAELELEDTVFLLGWRRDVPTLLWQADLLLLTSRWEGLPQVFPQAMAAGLPIVATAVDGAGEAVEHGLGGVLCDPGDVGGMTRGVLAVLADAELQRAMGAGGRERAEAFSSERMVAAIDRLYGDLTGISELN